MFKNIPEYFRTFQEQACHNQMDDGITYLPELEGLWRRYKIFVWQFLDGKYDSIIVWDSE